MNNVNTSVGNTSVGEEEYNLYGKPTITETLRGLTFQISANSFFQTNTSQVRNTPMTRILVLFLFLYNFFIFSHLICVVSAICDECIKSNV